jgi:serine/threonine-protein kinase RsbW
VNDVVRLEIPPRPDHLALVRLVLSGALAIERPVPERRVEDLRLAVTEACANAVDAQQAAGDPRPIEIVIEAAPGRVVVSVTDHAGGFDPDHLDPLPSVTDPGRLRHERGLGLALMRSHVDDVRFARTADGTEVTLTVESER